jgi:hypothetical protein
MAGSASSVGAALASLRKAARLREHRDPSRPEPNSAPEVKLAPIARALARPGIRPARGDDEVLLRLLETRLQARAESNAVELDDLLDQLGREGLN